MARDCKVFTVEEANALLPRLSYEFGLVFLLIRDMEEVMASLVSLGVKPSPSMADTRRADPPEVKRLKKHLKGLVSTIFDHYLKIQNIGIIVQDISSGRVSFYTYLGGHPAFLTWEYGENEVRWWHEIYEDADHRKPLHRMSSAPGLFN